MKSTVKAHKLHLQIIELDALGLTKAEIAAQLGISVSNVYWHIRREKARQERIRSALAANGGE
jgi:DNA-binding CsgD family transcriptional regulator